VSGVLLKNVLVAFPPYYFQYMQSTKQYTWWIPQKTTRRKLIPFMLHKKSGIHCITNSIPKRRSCRW